MNTFKHDIPQEAFDWYDDYVHGGMDRRTFIRKLSGLVALGYSMSLLTSALFPVGGYPGNDDQGRAMQRELERSKIEQDFLAAAHFLKQHSLSNGKLGAVGFCFGGYMVNYLAAVDSDLLSAGLPFYGTPAAKSLRANIKAPLMIQLGELDERVNKTYPEYEEDLKSAGVEFEIHRYENAKHGFHNGSTGRYDEANATLAWQRTIDFFSEHLRAS